MKEFNESLKSVDIRISGYFLTFYGQNKVKLVDRKHYLLTSVKANFLKTDAANMYLT